MPVKRKAGKTGKTPEVSQPEAERMTVVTEVVEMAQDTAVPKGDTVPPTESSELPAEDKSIEPPEKRKEVVEELFKSGETGVMPEIAMHQNGAKRTIFIWAVTVVTLAIIIGGGLLLMTRAPGRVALFAPRPTPTPTPIPTPTPEPIKRENLAIEVLNGGGAAGAASKMKKLLEEKGYKVEAVGNTEAYTYEKTEILVKPGKAAYLSLLEEDLKEKYTVGTAAATLASDAAYDAQIIVGSK